MRTWFAPIVAMLSVALTASVSQASPITTESLPPGAAADTHASGASSGDPGPTSGYSSLLDESGDPLFVLTSFNAFDPGSHGKLRGGPPNGGLHFVPTLAFGGFSPFGGGPGGPSSGPPGIGSFTLLSLGPQGPPPDPLFDLNLGGTPDPDFGPAGLFSLESCCETFATETALPEPSTLLLVGGGLIYAFRRAARSRSSSATTRS